MTTTGDPDHVAGGGMPAPTTTPRPSGASSGRSLGTRRLYAEGAAVDRCTAAAERKTTVLARGRPCRPHPPRRDRVDGRSAPHRAHRHPAQPPRRAARPPAGADPAGDAGGRRQRRCSPARCNGLAGRASSPGWAIGRRCSTISSSGTTASSRAHARPTCGRAILTGRSGPPASSAASRSPTSEPGPTG